MSAVPLVVLGEAAALAQAMAWYRVVSGGRATFEPRILPAHEPADGWAAYAHRGGLGPAPGNSQVLVERLLASLGPVAVPPAEAVVAVTPPGAGFAPHTWRLRGGGFWLGGRRWLRRFAIVPADAPVGTIAHEIGHLVFGWADHGRRDRVGADCLMGTGGGLAWPAPPCAPSRLDAGWVEAVPATRTMTVAGLSGGRVVRSRSRLIELGPSGDVLVYENGALTARIGAEPDRPLLALVASAMNGNPRPRGRGPARTAS